MLDEKIAAILRQLRHYLEDLYGDRLVKVILYGSYARGEARSDSDVDVLVVLRGAVNFADEIERTSYFVSSLCLKYNILLSCSFISNERFQQQQGGFLRNVRQEGITV